MAHSFKDNSFQKERRIKKVVKKDKKKVNWRNLREDEDLCLV